MAPPLPLPWAPKQAGARLPRQFKRLAFWLYSSHAFEPIAPKSPCECAAHENASVGYGIALGRLAALTGDGWGRHNWALAWYLDVLYAALAVMWRDTQGKDGLFVSKDGAHLIMPTRLKSRFDISQGVFFVARHNDVDLPGRTPRPWVFVDWMTSSHVYRYCERIGEKTALGLLPSTTGNICTLDGWSAFSTSLRVTYAAKEVLKLVDPYASHRPTDARATAELLRQSVRAARANPARVLSGWIEDEDAKYRGRSALLIPLGDAPQLYLVVQRVRGADDHYKAVAIVDAEQAAAYARVVCKQDQAPELAVNDVPAYRRLHRDQV